MRESGASGTETGDLVVRPARAEDRDAVFAFSSTTFDGDDYIPYVWDDWLGGDPERGALLVAAWDGQPVGVIHWRLLGDDEAWIEGIRVDPAARRRGVGRAMVSRALAGADAHGARVARLMTSERNVASQQLVGRFGFVRVAEVARYEAASEEEVEGVAAARLGPEDFDRVWSWLEESNLRPFTGGLEFDYWAARALSEPALRAYLAAGEVWALEEWGSLQALAVVMERPAEGDGPASLESRYTDGTADALGRLGLALRGIAGERGCAKAELWLPNLLILRDAMQGAGYTRDDEAMWIYAREL
jgi:ribosomal protein S18 acetylase RimI-like enzyme